MATYTGSDKRLQYLFEHGGADIWVGTLAEYTQQAAQIADGTTVLITDDEDNYITEYHVYSTTEHVIGQWIDGSTIYEKTIDFGALPANAQKNVNHGISNFDIIVQIIATATRPSSLGTHTSIPVPTAHWETIGNQNEISINDTTIMIRNHNSNASAFSKVYVTLRYTKSS